LTDLDAYGTHDGLAAWTLIPIIQAVAENSDTGEPLIERSRRLLEMYGPYDAGKENFNRLIVELIYYTAENLYFWSQSFQGVVSPFKSERIGSYSYDKGVATKESLKNLIESNDIVWSLVLHLRKFPDYVAVSTRVMYPALTSSETGVKNVIDTYNDRLARWLERNTIESDSREFDRIVYGY
jgi:hypothetical protein